MCFANCLKALRKLKRRRQTKPYPRKGDFTHRWFHRQDIKGSVKTVMLEEIDRCPSTNGEGYPLHLAVKNDDMKEALRLLQEGADIDKVDDNKDTPLVAAVQHGTFEMVCMLLYYGADAAKICSYNMTPLMHAIGREDYDMQEQLIEYGIRFDEVGDVLGCAIYSQSPFAIAIAQEYLDSSSAKEALYEFIDYPNFNLFKVFWDLINEKNIFIDAYNEILLDFLTGEQYNMFHYMLESHPIQRYVASFEAKDIVTILDTKEHGLSREDAEKVIYILLCNEWKPSEMVLNYIYIKFGYCELFRILLHMDIQVYNCRGVTRVAPIDKCFASKLPIPYVIYHIEPCLTITDLLADHILSHPLRLILFAIECDGFNAQDIFKFIVNTVVNFFTNRALFQELLSYIEDEDISCQEGVLEKLNRRVPSLLELSRDQVRFAICSKFQFTKSRQFYTYLQHLCIPLRTKQIIAFEVPLYV